MQRSRRLLCGDGADATARHPAGPPVTRWGADSATRRSRTQKATEYDSLAENCGLRVPSIGCCWLHTYCAGRFELDWIWAPSKIHGGRGHGSIWPQRGSATACGHHASRLHFSALGCSNHITRFWKLLEVSALDMFQNGARRLIFMFIYLTQWRSQMSTVSDTWQVLIYIMFIKSIIFQMWSF
jgi:hypothetical protein